MSEMTSFSLQLLTVLRAGGAMTTGQVRAALNYTITSDLISSYLTTLCRRGYLTKTPVDPRGRRFVWTPVAGMDNPRVGVPPRKPNPSFLPPPEPEWKPDRPRRTYPRTYDRVEFAVVWDGTDATA
jgi:hypothetical protein